MMSTIRAVGLCSAWGVVSGLLLVAGCSSPKEEAAQAAITYQRALLKGEYDRAHELASEKDRKARPEEELNRDMIPKKLRAMDTSVGDKISYKRLAVSVNGDRAEVDIKITAPDPFKDATLASTQTYRLVKEDGAWRVDTTWDE